MEKMTIGQRIRSARLALGMTEQQFADRIGVSRGSIQQWERDKTAPKRANQPAVAKLMGITVAQLMGTNADPNAIDVESRVVYEQNTAQPRVGYASEAIKKYTPTNTADALAQLQRALKAADHVDRAAAKAYLAGLCDAPERDDLLERIRLALEPPAASQATPETGAQRRAA